MEGLRPNRQSWQHVGVRKSCMYLSKQHYPYASLQHLMQLADRPEHYQEFDYIVQIQAIISAKYKVFHGTTEKHIKQICLE